MKQLLPLALSAQALTVSGPIDLTLANASAVDGVISGADTRLSKSGAGRLVLSGSNSYTGTTTVNAGTLEIGGAGLLGGGSYSGNIANTGTFLYNGTNSQTLSGVISGSGGLTKSNSGNLTLSANNTYTGTTTIINGGADYSAGNQLRLSNASGPAILGNVTIGNNSGTNAGAMLVTTQNNQLGSSSVITINNTSSGFGYFELRGTAQTIAGLSGAASARTVVQNQESGTLASAATLTINNTNNFTYGGIIRDAYFGSVAPLSIIKNGSGTQTFSGNNSYTGMTTINAGTLQNVVVQRYGNTLNLQSTVPGTAFDLSAASTNYSGNTISAQTVTDNKTAGTMASSSSNAPSHFAALGFYQGTFGGEVNEATSKMSPPRTGRLAFQIGANEGQKITIDLADFGKGGPITGEITWDADMDPMTPGARIPDPVQGGPSLMGKPLTRTFISSIDAAQDVLKKLDVAMDKVNQTRATMGAVMNRLDHVINNLSNVSMNLSASRSQIEDADYAAASTEMAKTQIMQQAATAVLAQANTSQQSVLKLLQG